jgi:pectin methylesterase-like acyl-CoA thioesterase
MRCSRAKSTLGIGLAALCVSLCPAQSVRECADSRGILIGTAVRPQLFSERAYPYTVARGFNLVEAEDAMKWWMAPARRGNLSTSRRPTGWLILLKHSA